MRFAAAAALLALAAAGTPGPLDISGDYNTVQKQTCRCWGQAQGRPCYCAAPGCQYVEQVSATPPGKDGVFQLTMQAADESCYTGQQGPFDLFVDRCGAVLTGASWHARSNATFNPQALDQEVDLLLTGNVLGFDGVRMRMQNVPARAPTWSQDVRVAGLPTARAKGVSVGWPMHAATLQPAAAD